MFCLFPQIVQRAVAHPVRKVFIQYLGRVLFHFTANVKHSSSLDAVHDQVESRVKLSFAQNQVQHRLDFVIILLIFETLKSGGHEEAQDKFASGLSDSFSWDVVIGENDHDAGLNVDSEPSAA
jgi:hypothetical protein